MASVIPETSADVSGDRLPFSAIPKRWPLVTTNQHRSAESTEDLEKDARLVNCIAELDPASNSYQVEKRPGLGNPVVVGGSSDSGLGVYSWNDDAYAVFGTKLYKNSVAFAPAIAGGSRWRFVQVLGATPKLVMNNGTQGWFTDGTTLTQITDADFPNPHRKGWAYLDGTLYILRPDGGIQGSAIDDPSSWDPLNVIIARDEPDLGVTLFKHLNYVVALKQWSTQAFYNAGNPTGSPLARVDGAFRPFGCISADSIAELDGMHFWISTNRSLAPQAIKMDNLQLSIVSTPPVERILKRFASTGTVTCFAMKLSGHRYYLINTSSMGFTLVYDIDQSLWYQWFSEPAFIGAGATTDGPWPVLDYTFSFGTNYVQHTLDGKLYEINSDFVFPTDNGTLFPVDIYTPNEDFGVRRKKQLNAMMINADQVVGSTLLVRSSDDDYKNYTNFRRVDLGIRQPILTGLGSFYKRVYHFRHRSNTAFRIKSADLQMDLGSF